MLFERYTDLDLNLPTNAEKYQGKNIEMSVREELIQACMSTSSSLFLEGKKLGSLGFEYFTEIWELSLVIIHETNLLLEPNHYWY